MNVAGKLMPKREVIVLMLQFGHLGIQIENLIWNAMGDET